MRKLQAIAIFGLLPLASVSAGHASTLNQLSSAEQSYHEKIFDYVMDTIDPDKTYDWASFSGKGTIKVGEPFISKSKSACRPFSEDYNIQGSGGKIRGYACKRSGDEGWCRLKPNAMLTCALENPSWSWGGTSGGGLDGGASYTGGSPSTSGSGVNMPDVNVGDVNITGPTVNIEAPKMHMPNMSGGGGNNGGGTQPQKGDTSHTDGNKGGQASGTAYNVTDTLGTGAAKGTGWAITTFQSWFR